MPTPGAIANRRFLALVLAAAGFISFIVVLASGPRGIGGFGATPIHHVDVKEATLKGDAIMGKLGNETLKAELGRAAWKLFHTTMARFPDKPTQDESTALFSYIHLFARLYPCGECAGHFRQILNKYPPQVDSRSTAAAWGCHVHNEVNKSLKKALFDCSNIGDFYDCGCADDEGSGDKAVSGAAPGGDWEVDALTGQGSRLTQSARQINGEFRRDPSKLELKLEKEGLTRGG